MSLKLEILDLTGSEETPFGLSADFTGFGTVSCSEFNLLKYGWSDVPEPTSSWTDIAKATLSWTSVSKPTTTYTEESKPTTTWTEE